MKIYSNITWKFMDEEFDNGRGVAEGIGCDLTTRQHTKQKVPF